MKTTIEIRETYHINGQAIVTLLGEYFATVDEARRKIADLRDPANDSKYDDYEFEIVRVCDEIENPDYCKVVEVLETL